MGVEFRSGSAPRLALTALAGAAVALGGCAYHGRIEGYTSHVESRYLGEPASRALQELGPPAYARPVADLRAYTWQTGQDGALGGNCRLSLVADRSGTVVDYAMSGTPLGCRRLLNMS